MTELEQIQRTWEAKEAQWQKQQAAYEHQLKVMESQMKLMAQKLYGRSSEKTSVDANQLSLFADMFNEAETCAAPEAPEPALEAIQPKQKKKGHRAAITKALETETVIQTLPAADCHCEWCETTLAPIGKEYVRSEVEFIPAKLKKIEYYTTAYACPQCKADGTDTIVKAPTPKPVIPNSLASAKSVAHIMHQKYVMSLPYHRQEKEWKAYGLDLPRATLANWTILPATRWLKPLVAQLDRYLVQADYLHADETTTQVLREPGKKATSTSYMWLFRTIKDSTQPVVRYHYAPSRSGDIPRDYLKDFKGYLHCDGYAGYHKVSAVTLVGCWAHARRKFKEALDAMPAALKNKPSISQSGLSYCNALFHLESQWAALSPEARHAKRLETAGPLLDEFWGWVEGTQLLDKTKTGQAIKYVKNQKVKLMAFLEDGHCDISNNLAERSIRPFVIGRKNWHFSSSVKGAEASALIYSIIETAKANHLDVKKYLTYLFENLPNTNFKEKPELLEAYLPWHPNIQVQCR